MRHDPLAPIRAWLVDWHTAVRNQDFAAGRAMCAPDMVAFGTVAPFVTGIDEIMKAQWSHVWPNITGFTIDAANARGEILGDRAWVAATWDSRGRRPDGTEFARPGRCTIVLARRDGRWLATHTHFSLSPAP
ncbi:MAG: nuclear transport factor 2 family protein [Candidatus Rokubacteria bacterium]|nr:nuclear transport factor 2 family protein [Candidatus Rokubacteria bacterium]